MDKLLLGIDFGTSTNFITKYDFSKKDAIPIENMGEFGKSNIFENTIYIESSSNIVLGALATKKGLSDPMNYFSDIKRYIVSDNWRERIPHFDNRLFSAQSIATLIFKEIKAKVEKSENRNIDGVVLTVPYAYSDTYRRKMKEAMDDAGINVLKIIEEPIAAAVSFGIFDNNLNIGEKEKVLVFDFGGGTFDITIFEFRKESKTHSKIEVLNTDGVERLGGKDIDAIIVSKFRDYLGIQYDDIKNNIELKKYQENLIKLAIETKENLSEDDEYDIYENYMVDGISKELELDLSRNEFNKWLKENNIIGMIEDALDRTIMDVEPELEAEDINRIILAGGSSSIPIIYETVKKYFGKEPQSSKNLGELVGHGAGVIAGLTEDKTLGYEIIRKVNKNIGIAKGNKFETILLKNTKYGKESSIYNINLENQKNDSFKITLYEGDSSIIEHCEEIGKITIESSLSTNKIGLTLSKDEDKGLIVYHLYDSNGLKIKSDYIESIGA